MTSIWAIPTAIIISIFSYFLMDFEEPQPEAWEPPVAPIKCLYKEAEIERLVPLANVAGFAGEQAANRIALILQRCG